jgi:hypothetical protein
MVGWILVGIGVLALAQELWWHPRNMAKVRKNVSRRGDPSRFDAFLGSRQHKQLRWSGLAMGAGMVVVGILVVSGVT